MSVHSHENYCKNHSMEFDFFANDLKGQLLGDKDNSTYDTYMAEISIQSID